MRSCNNRFWCCVCSSLRLLWPFWNHWITWNIVCLCFKFMHLLPESASKVSGWCTWSVALAGSALDALPCDDGHCCVCWELRRLQPLHSIAHILFLLSDSHKIKRGVENCQGMYREETYWGAEAGRPTAVPHPLRPFISDPFTVTGFGHSPHTQFMHTCS